MNHGRERWLSSLVALGLLLVFGAAAVALSSVRPALEVLADGTVAPMARADLLRVHVRDYALWLPFLLVILALAPVLVERRRIAMLAGHAAVLSGCLLAYPLLSASVLGTFDRGVAWHFGRDAASVALMYGVTVTGWAAVHTLMALQSHRVRAHALEALLAGARLEALQMQLHPHFLFNSLHAIGSTIETQPREAQRMVTVLGDLLRSTLAKQGAPLVTLRDEITWMERYLDLQRLRFGERLDARMDVDDGVTGALVPTLILQPLVENAITHGTDPETGAVSLHVNARRSEDRLILSVRDCGTLRRDAPDRPRPGLGLANTRARIAAASRGEGELIWVQDEHGTVVTIVLPFTESAPPPA